MTFIKNFFEGMFILPLYLIVILLSLSLIVFCIFGPFWLAFTYNNFYFLLLYLPTIGLMNAFLEMKIAR